MNKLLLTALISISAFGQIAFVQAIGKDDNAVDGTTLTSGTMSTTTGNLLYAVVHLSNNCNSVGMTFALKNAANVSFTQIGSTFQDAGGFTCTAHFYMPNITGNASDAFTLTTSAPAHLRSFSVAEFSGLATTSPLDKSCSPINDSATATATSCSFTTAVADELIVGGGAASTYGKTWTAGSGYTLATGATGTNTVTHMQYKIVSSIQTSVTQSISIDTAALDLALTTATFKIAGGAVTAPVKRRVVQ